MYLTDCITDCTEFLQTTQEVDNRLKLFIKDDRQMENKHRKICSTLTRPQWDTSYPPEWLSQRTHFKDFKLYSESRALKDWQRKWNCS